MRKAAFAVTVGLASFVFACSSSSSGTGGGGGRVALDVTAACNRAIDECKSSITRAQCEQGFGILRVTPDCQSKFQSATCEELLADDGAVEEACFPQCSSPGTQTCNGDGTITICGKSNSRESVADCGALCQQLGSGSFSGTCGKSFGGQTSETDKCWCQ